MLLIQGFGAVPGHGAVRPERARVTALKFTHPGEAEGGAFVAARFIGRFFNGGSFRSGVAEKPIGGVKWR